jgi:hypothetical protein
LWRYHRILFSDVFLDVQTSLTIKKLDKLFANSKNQFITTTNF